VKQLEIKLVMCQEIYLAQYRALPMELRLEIILALKMVIQQG
jgi:hypothetical protein